MASQRFHLGTYFGIGLFVHWTFGLLIAYAMYLAWSAGGGVVMIAYSVAQLLTVFACVTLHEYGHALAARRFGVGTHDITLLPIGGVARLNRIPRIPHQEFVIAIAGPAVNVVIAMVLAILLVVAGHGELFQTLSRYLLTEVSEEQAEQLQGGMLELLSGPSLAGFGLTILLINLMLVVFNMIPAFPMDGGRVLRSLLAMNLPYVSATRWAQRVGMVCALLMAGFALSTDPPWLVMALIAGFIVFAGLAEVRQVELREALQGLTVGDVMTTHVPRVPADMPVDRLWRWWQGYPGQVAAVVGINGILLGLVRLQDLVTFLKRHASESPDSMPAQSYLQPFEEPEPSMRTGPAAPAPRSRFGNRGTAVDLADPHAEVLDVNQSLEGLLGSGRQNQREFAVTDSQGNLIGWLDLETLLQRAAIVRSFPSTATGSQPLSIDHHA